MDFKIVGPRFEESAACTAILQALPEWFGLEKAIHDYEKTIGSLPTFLARAGTQILGFLSLKQHFPQSAEIYVMAVRKEVHRRGIGRALAAAAETHAHAMGIEYLQVKTLGPSHPDNGYARTRLFYEAVGFRPLEEFPRVWDDNNPCLVMVKRLQ